MSVFVRFTAKDVATLMATSMIVKGQMLSYLVMMFGVYKHAHIVHTTENTSFYEAAEDALECKVDIDIVMT